MSPCEHVGTSISSLDDECFGVYSNHGQHGGEDWFHLALSHNRRAEREEEEFQTWRVLFFSPCSGWRRGQTGPQAALKMREGPGGAGRGPGDPVEARGRSLCKQTPAVCYGWQAGGDAAPRLRARRFPPLWQNRTEPGASRSERTNKERVMAENHLFGL